MNVPSGASEFVRGVCDLACELTTGSPHAGAAQRVRARLDGPLLVAIAGRVKSGKSTLLNALVGERLAPTDAGECTRIVTWYQEATGYEVRAHLKSGDRRDLAFARDHGALAVDLDGLVPEQVDRLEVGWPSSALTTVTLIDTPGLVSIDADTSQRSEDFLAADGEVPQADAVVYLMRHLHRNDVEFLESFGDHSVTQSSPLNAVAVLSRADELGAARPDALESAARIAERYRTHDELRRLCATVLPVAGLLAETGLTIQEDETAALRALAGMPATKLDDLLLSADRFRAAGVSPVAPEVRAALLARLGVFGVRFCIDALASSRASNATELARELVAASGLLDLRRLLSDHFARRARLLKARSALRALRQLAHEVALSDADLGRRLAGEVERVEAASHEFAELRLLYLVLSGQVVLSESETAEVTALVGDGTGPERLRATPGVDGPPTREVVVAAIDRWRRKAAHGKTDVETREVCDIVARTYEALYVDLPE